MSHVPKPGTNYVSLLQYAKHYNVVYKTAFNRFHKGKIPGAYKSEEDGHVYVPVEALQDGRSKEVVLYVTAPSDSDEDLERMESDAETMARYAQRRGWQVVRVVKEVCREIIGGFRPRFNDLLGDRNVRKILINKKADVCFYGFEYIKTLLNSQGRSIHAMDKSNEVTDKRRVMREVVNTIYSAVKVAAGDAPVSKLQIRRVINRFLTDLL